ncbi:MAG: hypothetical protein ABI333_07970 [bacterium]
MQPVQLRIAALAAVLFGLVTTVQAQPTSPERSTPPASSDTAAKPWAKGVSTVRRTAALARFRTGNGFFERSEYAQALTEYQEAVKSWDHPAIRYNMAVSLVHLDRPVKAYRSLRGALRYGQAPLGPKLYMQALTYRKLLRGRLALLKVVCREAGARVTLDGKLLFNAPGEHRQHLLPGKHALMVSKDGYLTETRAPFLIPGRETILRIKLLPMASAIRMKRRWKRWWPWTILGGGLLVALSGVPLLLKARSDLNDYDSQLKSLCPTGCEVNSLPRAVTDLESRAHQENRAAIALFAVGGAVVIAGITFVILNQPRAVQMKPGEVPERPVVSVTPTLGPGGGGVSATLRF